MSNVENRTEIAPDRDFLYLIDPARHMVAFRLRSPIMYYLWYRMRLMPKLTAEERREFYRIMNDFKSTNMSTAPSPTYEQEFAMRNPCLYFFVDFYKFLKEVFTIPRKLVSTIVTSAAFSKLT